MSESLIIDCDPGVDDCVALLLAFASPELEILAVTTVAGNVGAQLTARNARIIRQIAGRKDVPVHAGAERPLVRVPVEAGHFHGESGLGDMAPFEPDAPAEAEPSADAIVRRVRERPAGTVTIGALGPLTNVALALQAAPDIAGRIKQIVLMGGARSEGGNITASAEYNIHADPHAADVVFRSGVPTVVMGLDVTHQVRATEARTTRLRAARNPRAQTALRMIDFSNGIERRLVGGQSAPLHDPCVIAWLIRPDLFELMPANIQVETQSQLTLGHTAVEFRLNDQHPQNARWGVSADADAVFGLLTERLS